MDDVKLEAYPAYELNDRYRCTECEEEIPEYRVYNYNQLCCACLNDRDIYDEP